MSFPDDLWIVDPNNAKLYKVNDADRSVEYKFPTESRPSSVFVCPDQRSVIVVNKNSDSITIFRNDSSRATYVDVGSQPYAACQSPYGAVFVTNYNSNTVSKIKDGEVNATISVDAGPTGICSDKQGNIYVCCSLVNEVIKLNRDNNETTETTITVGRNPIGITCDVYGTIWVCNHDENTVSRIEKDKVVATIETMQGPIAITTITDGTPYVACDTSNVVQLINRDDNTIKATVNVGAGPNAISVNSRNEVWVASGSGNDVRKIVGTELRDMIEVCDNNTGFGDFTGGAWWNVLHFEVPEDPDKEPDPDPDPDEPTGNCCDEILDRLDTIIDKMNDDCCCDDNCNCDCDININNDLDTILTKLADVLMEVSDLKTKVDRLQDTYDTEINDIKLRLNDLEAKAKNLQSQINNIKKDIKTINATIDNMQLQLATMTDDINNLKEEVSTLQTKVEDLTTRMDTMENTTIPELTDRVDTIENETIPGLQEDIENLQKLGIEEIVANAEAGQILKVNKSKGKLFADNETWILKAPSTDEEEAAYKRLKNQKIDRFDDQRIFALHTDSIYEYDEGDQVFRITGVVSEVLPKKIFIFDPLLNKLYWYDGKLRTFPIFSKIYKEDIDNIISGGIYDEDNPCCCGPLDTTEIDSIL